MNLIYIRPGDAVWKNEFKEPNRQFIYWDTDGTGTGFAKKSPFREDAVELFAVLNMKSERICGVYRFGSPEEEKGHPDLNGRHLLVKVANLNHEFKKRPPGFTYGCSWYFDPSLIIP